MKRILVGFFAVLLLLTGFSPASHTTPIDTRTLATVNKPGVVLVQTTWTADVTWYEFAIDESMETDLVYELDRMIEAGEIGSSEQELYQAMVGLMINYMEYYAFSTGNTETEQMSTAAVGTGFIVTPDGYMVTNAHVVHTNEEELNLQFAMTSLEQYAVEAADSFMEEMRRLGYEMSQEEWDGIANAWYRLLAQSMEINNLQTSYQCYIGNISPGSDVSAKGKELDLRKMGEPIPGKDIAILKMEGTNLPTVKLGDDTKLRTGDRVYAMGYPAVATLSGALNVTQAIQEPTLTQGIISAKKEMAGGWSVIQTDAAIHGGNSGGPLFNDAGEVVAVNTFGMVDESGTSAPGMNFAIPISIAKQFLNEINVQSSESEFTTNFSKALTAYNGGDYNSALELLRGINETNPGFPVVQDLLADARQAADANPQSEKTTDSDTVDNDATQVLTQGDHAKGNRILGLPRIFIYVAVTLVFLIIAVVILVVLLSRKKRPATITPVVQASSPHQVAPAKPAIITPKASVLHCARCNTDLSENAKFCKECGEAVPVVPSNCPECNAPIPPGSESKFCMECGKKFPG